MFRYLLRADCAVPTQRFTRLLERSSQRCRLRYIRALKDRRDRLKKLATDTLSTAEAQQLGLFGEAVLDFHTPQVVRLLQQRGVRIPEALEATESLPSVYEGLRDPSDAEFFFRLGFRDTGLWLKKYNDKGWGLPMLPLPYIEWLDSHGVDALVVSIATFGNGNRLFTAHSTFHAIGRQMHSIGRGLDRTSPEWVQGLHNALLRPDLADGCRCRCSTESCTPLIYLIKGIYTHFSTWNYWDIIPRPFCLFLELFGGHLEIQHHRASLRFLTFSALGIQHTCCDPLRRYRHSVDDPEEIEAEHAYELELLETLLEEFESEVIGILQDPDRGLDDLVDFWERTWLGRVLELQQHLDRNDVSDDERQRGEEIGVVWDQPSPPEPPKRSSNPFDKKTLDHWVFELEKIEAECQ
jgi:hypothetical protein